MRSAYIDFKGKLDEYISSIYALSLLSGGIISVIIAIGLIFFGLERYLPLAMLCCVQAVSNGIIVAVQVRYLMEIKYVKRCILQSIPNIIISILSVVLINQFSDEKYLGRIIPYVIVNVGIALYLLLKYFFFGRTGYSKKIWRYALVFSLPLIFHSLSNVILGQADRTMITALCGTEETGLYTLAYQFGLVPLVITTTMENV